MMSELLKAAGADGSSGAAGCACMALGCGAAGGAAGEVAVAAATADASEAAATVKTGIPIFDNKTAKINPNEARRCAARMVSPPLRETHTRWISTTIICAVANRAECERV